MATPLRRGSLSPSIALPGLPTMLRIPIKPILEALAQEPGYIPDAGDKWMPCRCPFHGERRASASVSEFGFNCHACGIKGDAISLIQQMEGCEYASALERAAQILGRSAEEISGGLDGRRSRRRLLDDDTRTVVGQRNLLSSRRRRKPVAGS